MKILIVDDHPKRYQIILEDLEKIGIERGQIDIVQSANAARDCLDASSYDLMVLDILIPLRAGDEERETNSLDLITDIEGGGLNHKPRQIVGITADEQAAGKAYPVFLEHLWALVRFREDNTEWARQIVNCAEYLMKSGDSDQRRGYGVDVAIICALPTPELRAIRALNWSWQPARPIDEGTFVYDGTVACEGVNLTAVCCSPPRMGMIASSLLAAKIIDQLRPRLLIMAGICAGVPSRAQLGDVILADPSWDWQSGKRTRDKDNTQFSAAPHQLPVPAVVRSHVEQIADDIASLRQIASNWSGASPGEFKVKPGPVASGSAVLADGEVIALIKDQQRELCGIEMEAYGVYAAGHTASSPQPLTFALKAVCDFADENKNDDYQEYAAYTSASVIDLLLRRFGSRLVAATRG